MEPERPTPHRRKFGRAAFLAMTAASIGAVAYGKAGVPRLELVPALDSVGGFTIYTVINGYPTYHPDTYRLRIDGMVDRPLSLSLADILSEKAVHEVRDYQCVTGWSVPHCHWTGLRLSDLLDRVSPHADAGALTFYSFDGMYEESLTIPQARRSDVLLAYTLNGKPLSTAQGAPLRLVVPGMYGYKYIKWVHRVELVPRPIQGFWELRGYDRDAWIGHSNSFISSPAGS